MESLEGVNYYVGPSGREVVFAEGLSEKTFSHFLAAMMKGGLEFSLYDALYPSPSDPGAYLSYRPIGGTWKMTLGNHGWSGGIYDIEPAAICRQLKNLHDKGLLTGLRLEGVCFFSHYALESQEKSRAMNERLYQIHG